jgi:hypothetical protein
MIAHGGINPRLLTKEGVSVRIWRANPEIFVVVMVPIRG